MLAGLKAITVIPHVTDPYGRAGTAVALTTRLGGGGVMQTRLIVDPGTGRALAEEDVVTRPGGTTAGFAPGTVIDYTAYKAAGWTNAAPTR
jgi:hypothetical protein